MLDASDVLGGTLDPGLDSFGQFQAMLLGAVMARLPIAVVVSSPLRRAELTARAIAERVGLPVEIDERLIDRDYGAFSGRPRSELLHRWGSPDVAPQVETAEEVAQRATDALDDISDRTSGGSAVVISHEAVNRCVLSHLDTSLGGSAELEQGPGCINVLAGRRRYWAVLQVGIVPQAVSTAIDLGGPPSKAFVSGNSSLDWDAS
jgi:broad specificity phosphatase PhoE